MVSKTLSEQEKMARVPGIVFVDEGAGRRARVKGTGLEVFEIIDAYHDLGDDREALAEVFDHVAPAHLDAALHYYREFPDEIDEELERRAQVMRTLMRERGIEPDF